MGHRDLLASLTMDQNFTGKVTHGRHVFISIAQGSIEENDAIISKKLKAKENTAVKMENVLRGKTTTRQTTFKLTIRSDC